MSAEELLTSLVQKGGSDLHLKVGRPPLMRIHGDLLPTDSPPLTRDDLEGLIRPMLTELQTKTMREERELDFSYAVTGLARFRGNIFFQMGNPGAVFRAIPERIEGVDELGLPPILREIAGRRQGIVLVTGPTGSGKSTTLAAMIDLINESRPDHIVTIEDPVEFVHRDKRCTINQREIGSDTKSFAEALKRALRQDPDIILVGEMRDRETISIAMTAAETGHLVFSTLHTVDARQSVDRIIDTFPPDQHHQVRMQLAMTLAACVSQRLVRTADGQKRVAVVEVMINTPTIRKLIEEGKVGMMDKVIAESASLYRMQTQNQHLFQLVSSGTITKDDALGISKNRNDLNIMFQTSTSYSPETSTKTEPESASPPGGGKGLGSRPSPFVKGLSPGK
jgi:twitching motility protein PilT